MPVLNVAEARHVIVYNLDRSPGYAGVENTLYDMEHCIFVPGDAAVTLEYHPAGSAPGELIQ